MLTRAPLPAIEVRDGGVAIDGRPILRHLDLQVLPGEFVALMGANGSGKSTLIRALMGLHPLSTGEIRIDGVPLQRFTAWHRIGFVPQRSSVMGGVPASVREVVAAGRLSRRRLWWPLSRADQQAIDNALDAVDLRDRARDGVASLSGGQQQRVMIARALAGEPDIVVLDEPTAGVDITNQRALADILGRLKSSGATVVLVAHELGPLAALVDRTVVMTDGRIVYDGAPLSDHALHQPAYGEAAPEQARRAIDAHGHHHHSPAHADHAPHLGLLSDGGER